MLNDIIEEYDIENNFSYLISKYANYLERNGKWNTATNPKHAKTNWTSRLKRLHNEGETGGREYTKFKDQVEKWKHRDQKQAERIAKNLMGDKEKQLQNQLAEAMKIIEAQKLEIEQLKEMNIQLEKEKGDLISKYDEGYEKLEEENEQLREEILGKETHIDNLFNKLLEKRVKWEEIEKCGDIQGDDI